MGHIPREISCHVYHFVKTEGGFVNGSVISTKYRPSLIPCSGLEILFLFKFSCPEQKTFMITITNDYDYDCFALSLKILFVLVIPF